MPSLADTHRRDLNELVRLAHLDLRVLFDQYDDPDTLTDALTSTMPVLIGLYGSAAATLAADWYDDLRDASRVRGRFIASPTELPDPERGEILGRWATGPMFSDTPDKATAYSLAAGGFQRIIADADRQTITQSSTDDRRSPGWERVTAGGCDWCADQAGEHTGPDFGSHDHCSCVAVPSFR